ncbi:YggS family pyridoxal phosphate-dependent enzyme [bacterium]|nr:YggS family pyridoxal phosphate-dependent enzyme [bacterium]
MNGVSPPASVARARDDILARIAAAAASVNRDPSTVHLTAVSKLQPDEAVDAMLAAGQRRFGENRVQEATRRWTPRRSGYPDLELRLIGPLQTNKAKDAVSMFDVIETLDRERLAASIADACAKLGRRPQLLVQVNTGEEIQKAGVPPRDVDAFVRRARETFGLKVSGVMCIPPVGEPAGPHFALLANISRRHGLEVISMGMSADFELAVRFGATHVRVGSALFGARPGT